MEVIDPLWLSFIEEDDTLEEASLSLVVLLECEWGEYLLGELEEELLAAPDASR